MSNTTRIKMTPAERNTLNELLALQASHGPALVESDETGTTFTLVGQTCWVTVGRIAFFIQDLGPLAEIQAFVDGREMEPGAMLGKLRVAQPTDPKEE
jgi:hypothetical protein